MANEKILNTRIQLKYDSYKNWVEKNPTLLSGEVAIAYLPPRPETEHTNPAPAAVASATLIKVGPGQFNALPWLSATAADVYDWAKKPEAEFKAWVKGLIDVNDIDLSNYYNKGEVDGIINGIDTGVMAVTTGATNGTIAVDGTDVAVFGLGSAAYTNSDAYATAAQGALAATAVQPAAIADMATTVNVATAKQEAIDAAAAAAALIYKTEDEIKTIAATEIGRLIDASGDAETLKSIGDLVDYAEKNAGDIAKLVTDVGTANTNASNAVNTANDAAGVASAASGVANEAKELAQAAKETAETAQNSASASATLAGEKAEAAAASAVLAGEKADAASASAQAAAQSESKAGEAKDAAVAAQGAAESAQAAANASAEAAATAKQGAETAQGLAVSAKEAAAESARLAGVSETNAAGSANAAATAQSKAEDAQAAAEAAQSKAEEAQAAAEQAKADAEASNTSATAIANAAKSEAEAATAASNTATQAVAGLNQTISGYGDIVSHNASEFATAAQGALADTALQDSDVHALGKSGNLYDSVNVGTAKNANNEDVPCFIFYCGTASDLV